MKEKTVLYRGSLNGEPIYFEVEASEYDQAEIFIRCTDVPVQSFLSFEFYVWFEAQLRKFRLTAHAMELCNVHDSLTSNEICL